MSTMKQAEGVTACKCRQVDVATAECEGGVKCGTMALRVHCGLPAGRHCTRSALLRVQQAAHGCLWPERWLQGEVALRSLATRKGQGCGRRMQVHAPQDGATRSCLERGHSGVQARRGVLAAEVMAGCVCGSGCLAECVAEGT